MVRVRPALLWLMGLAALGELAGCVLLVKADPDDYGAHCRFKGDDTTPCGLCIAEKCQLEVDATCLDLKVAAALEQLDACAEVLDPASCGTLLATAKGTSALSMFGQCMRDNCATACTAPGGNSYAKCSSYASNSSCRCTTDLPYNNEACTPEVAEDGVCCADLGWPGRDLSCQCQRFACQQTSDGCDCSVGGSGPLSSCTGLYCCANGESCDCSNRACYDFETPVTKCSASVVGCLSDRARVAKCSAPGGK